MTQSFNFLVAAAIFSVVFVVSVANPTPTIERSPITQDAPLQQAEGESDAPSQQAEGESDAPSQEAEGESDASSQEAEGEIDAPSQEAEGESDASSQEAEGESDAPSQQAEGESDASSQEAEGESDASSHQAEGESNASSQQAEGESDAPSQQAEGESDAPSQEAEGESDAPSQEAEGESDAESQQAEGEIDAESHGMQQRVATLQSRIAGLEEAVQQLRARVLPEMGEARLVDGTQNEGFVLVYTGEQLGWGLVCDDIFNTSNVGATVVCKQLGYDSGSFRQADAPSSWVTDRYKFVLDDVNCRSGDTSLTQCRHAQLGAHNCVFKEAVRVACSG